MNRTRTDKTLFIVTALFVGALAFVAGAISFSHMRELALHHDQLGWKSLAFPISVDGLEIVASLYLVAQRRAGRPTGPIPWVALIVGTLASLAANVAVGGADPIGKALAGWPALSMLVSVKLLFAMFDHESVDQRTTVADDQRHPRNPPGRAARATLRHQVEAGHDFQAVHADRERVRLPPKLIVVGGQLPHVSEADSARDDGQSADEQRGEDQQGLVGSGLHRVTSRALAADAVSVDRATRTGAA